MTNSNKHSSAPWIYTPSKNKEHEGMNLFTITPEWPSAWNANGGYPIARTIGDISEANARLIAAAPELLEAVEFLINESKGRGIHIKDGIGFQKAKNAIKKAKGKNHDL